MTEVGTLPPESPLSLSRIEVLLRAIKL